MTIHLGWDQLLLIILIYYGTIQISNTTHIRPRWLHELSDTIDVNLAVVFLELCVTV